MAAPRASPSAPTAASSMSAAITTAISRSCGCKARSWCRSAPSGCPAIRHRCAATHLEGPAMRAMRLAAAHQRLSLDEHVPLPQPGPQQVLLRVSACGVCRTDLHIVDGELTEPKLPLTPGHEIRSEEHTSELQSPVH